MAGGRGKNLRRWEEGVESGGWEVKSSKRVGEGEENRENMQGERMKGGGSRGRKEHSSVERWGKCRKKEGG